MVLQRKAVDISIDTNSSMPSPNTSSPGSPAQVFTPSSASSITSIEDSDAVMPPFASAVIIGAGNFGAGTALSLARQGVRVTLVDTAAFPSPRAASHDINKIVRDDYPDLMYMRMMVKAMPMWRNNNLFKQWYHETGVLRADPSDFPAKSMEAYKKLGIPNDSEMLPVEEVRRRWNGIFATANFDGLSEVLYNPTVGIAEADKALAAVVQAGIDCGVTYVIGEMDKLVITSGECTGVSLKSGRVLHAEKVLLAAGARTGMLLAQSAPDNKKLHIGDRMEATGAISFYAKLTPELHKKYSEIPVLKNCLKQVKGESMSVLADGTIKFNCDMCFTNNIDFAPTGEVLSQPPSDPKYNTWTGPDFVEFFKQRAASTFKGLYGDAVANLPIEKYRICWDASTPTHDFLIAAHPHCDGLYVATGGSFHGWKFLPVIGDYIGAMMQGKLDQEYVDRWAWDKKGGDGHSANPTYSVVGDLQDWIN